MAFSENSIFKFKRRFSAMTSSIESSRVGVIGGIHAELRAFGSLGNILDKAERDGYLALLSSSIDTIFRKEITYSVCGRLTRNQAIERQVGFL